MESSDPGKAATASSLPSASLETGRLEPTRLESSRTGARIVLVDDDDSFRESLGLNLLDEGFDVVSFSGGAAALEHFAGGGEADVILLDWRMPRINGLEVLRRLRRGGTTTPVIFSRY
jgi:two-component system response regulator ChvI